MFKKFLFYIILFSVSSSLFSAAIIQLEERPNKEGEAKSFYEYIEKNNFDVETELLFLELAYYDMKNMNIWRIREKLSKMFAPETSVPQAWSSIQATNQINLFTLSEILKNKILSKIPNITEEEVNKIITPLLDANMNFDYYKELYKLIYEKIKKANPKLLKVNSFEDKGKPFPAPEKLHRDYWFQRHGFEGYKPE